MTERLESEIDKCGKTRKRRRRTKRAVEGRGGVGVRGLRRMRSNRRTITVTQREAEEELFSVTNTKEKLKREGKVR